MPSVEYLSYDIVEGRGWDLSENDTFEKAADAELSGEHHGSIDVSNGESILDAAEREDLGWSLKCYAGRCGRCVALVVDGEIEMEAGQEFLTSEEVEENDLCLPCITTPKTDIKLVYGVRRLDSLERRVK